MSKLQELSPESGAAFRKVEKQTVTDDVESQLREAILDGRLKPGESLAEAQLATQFGVSRASVRQAKFQLAQEGLLEFDSRGTASVRTLTQADVQEIVEFREVLDSAAIRLACSRLSDNSVSKLTNCITRIEAAPNLLQLTLLDIAFHEEIVRAAQNSRLLTAWQLLRPQLVFWLASMQRLHASAVSGTQSETAESHRELLSALQSGDADRCEQLARRHANGLRKLFDSIHSTSNQSGEPDD
jgi:DNA-binding GntR family transcriptional regulator